MTEYRVYCLDGTGKISATGEWIEAASDEEAIAIVRAKGLSVRCEVWDGDRLVANVSMYQSA
jgi:hypothetical protein